MIDTHSHLDFPEFDADREEVIRRAFDNGVKAIINVGVDLDRSRKSIEIAEKHEGVFASVGMHPDWFTQHETHNTKHDWFAELKKMAKHKKVVAIGECGLDYYHTTRNTQHETQELERTKKNQKAGFLAQIEIARELNLPVIVHCRDVHPVASDGMSEWFGAWQDVYEIVNSQSTKTQNAKQRTGHKTQSTKKMPHTKFVLHCYSGSAKDTENFLKLPNVYFSFSGNITYPKPVDRARQLAEALQMIPLDRIMLDSDSPFLAPQIVRGKRNEPMHISDIAYKIAEIKGISDQEVEKRTDANAIKFFGLDFLRD